MSPQENHRTLSPAFSNGDINNPKIKIVCECDLNCCLLWEFKFTIASFLDGLKPSGTKLYHIHSIITKCPICIIHGTIASR